MSQVSLIVPFYNEAAKFERFRTIMTEYLKTNKWVTQLILVDDGSTDSTLHLLNEFANGVAIEVKIIALKANFGKGHAIKRGVEAADKPWVLCNDADFSYLPEQLDEWVDAGRLNLLKPEKAHFGSRELGAKMGWVKFKWYRRVIGRIYALLIRMVTGIRVTDTQCGFKLYPTPLAKQIFSQVKEERFAFDVEVHYLLRKMNAEPVMLPVKCIELGDSKVHLIKDSIQMGMALWKIRKQHG